MARWQTNFVKALPGGDEPDIVLVSCAGAGLEPEQVEKACSGAAAMPSFDSRPAWHAADSRLDLQLSGQALLR